MKMLTRAALWLSALCACAIAAPAAAQKAQAPAGFAPITTLCLGAVGETVTCPTTLPSEPKLTAATSTPLTGSPTVGTTVLGPMVPQLGRDLRLIITGTFAGTIIVGTSVDACATVNPLTIGGAAWGSYTANANEVVDTPTLSGVAYCVTAVVSSGAPSVSLRQ